MGEINISNDNVVMLMNLYNSLKIGLFKRIIILSKNEFKKNIGITETNNKTYNRVISILQEHNIVEFENYFLNGKAKRRMTIDSNKLDRLIRETNMFKITDDFIFKSTGGVAETGV